MTFLIYLMSFIGICLVTTFCIIWLAHLNNCFRNGECIRAQTDGEYRAIMKIYENHMHVKAHYEKLGRKMGKP